MTYHPPCTITPVIERLLGEIREIVGPLYASADREDDLRLRRVNRIHAIRGSLAIEGNTLSEEQMTAILEGKRVVAPPREIQEARNAIKIYDRLEQLDPDRESDLLSAHEIMMLGLVDFPGRYRSGGDEIIVEKYGVFTPAGVLQRPGPKHGDDRLRTICGVHARHDQRSP